MEFFTHMQRVKISIGLAILSLSLACAPYKLRVSVKNQVEPINPTPTQSTAAVTTNPPVAAVPQAVPSPAPLPPFSMKDQKSIPALVTFSDTHPDTQMIKAITGRMDGKSLYWALVSWDEHPELPFQSVCQDRPRSEHTVILHLDDKGNLIETFGNKGVFELPPEKDQVLIGDLFFQNNRLLVVKENYSNNTYALQSYTLDGKGIDSSFGDQGTLLFPQFPPLKDNRNEGMCGEQLPNIKIFINRADGSFVSLGIRQNYNLLSRYTADGVSIKGFGKTRRLGKEKYVIPVGTIVLPPLPKEHYLDYVFFSASGDLTLLGRKHVEPSGSGSGKALPAQTVLLLYDNLGHILTKKSYLIVDYNIFKAIWRYETLRQGITLSEEAEVE